MSNEIASGNETESAASSLSIVIAEDSPPNRKILAHLIQKLGFQVHAFEHGQQAWDAINGGQLSCDCVISDIMMPNMDGIQLLRQIRESEKFANIPVLLITAVSEKEYTAQAHTLKVSGYILKPVTFQRLRERLEQLFPNHNFPKISA